MLSPLRQKSHLILTTILWYRYHHPHWQMRKLKLRKDRQLYQAKKRTELTFTPVMSNSTGWSLSCNAKLFPRILRWEKGGITMRLRFQVKAKTLLVCFPRLKCRQNNPHIQVLLCWVNLGPSSGGVSLVHEKWIICTEKLMIPLVVIQLIWVNRKALCKVLWLKIWKSEEKLPSSFLHS